MSGPGAGTQIVICGLGGQGILFLSRVLATAAIEQGDEVLAAETHGMSQRGGAVEAHLKLGSFQSSLVRHGSADTVLVLDPSRVDAALPYLRPDGACFANAPGDTPGASTVDAAGPARASDLARGENLVLLGFAAGSAPERFPPFAALSAALARLSPAAYVQANQSSLEVGLSLANGA